MYAVGRQRVFREQAQAFFLSAIEDRTPLVSSAEVLQELLHAYLRVSRIAGSTRATLHVACCRRREIRRIQTFDRSLATAF